MVQSPRGRVTTAGDNVQFAEAAVVGAMAPRGSTANFQVSYDVSLGDNGIAVADAVLGTCEADYARLLAWFRNPNVGGLPFAVSIVPGSTGASHPSCAATGISVDAFSGIDQELTRMLVASEVDEVLMAAVGNWDCGASPGEGLSRVLARELHPASSADARLFLTANYWLDHGRQNWITQTDFSDGHYASIGCATLYLNWLRYELHYGWAQIIAAGAVTLAQTYANLTGRENALDAFTPAVNARFPVGTPSGLTATDNAFPVELQLSGQTDVGELLHTIRHPDGSWQDFRNVKGQIGDPGYVLRTAAGGVDREFHLVGSTDSGFLFHTIRHFGGPWQPFGDVKGAIGDPGHVVEVAAAGLNGNLHVAGRTDSGFPFHAMRFSPAGNWLPFDDVKGLIGDPGFISGVAVAGVDGDLQMGMVSDSGGLFHTIRFSLAGNWQPFGDVKGEAGDPGHVSVVACAEVGGDLHMVVATDSGSLYHTIRFSPGGNWQPFGNVKGEAGDPGFVSAVTCAGVAGDLQVTVVTETGGIFHTIRFTGRGNWQPFGDVAGQAGRGHHFAGCAGTGV